MLLIRVFHTFFGNDFQSLSQNYRIWKFITAKDDNVISVNLAARMYRQEIVSHQAFLTHYKILSSWYVKASMRGIGWNINEKGKWLEYLLSCKKSSRGIRREPEKSTCGQGDRPIDIKEPCYWLYRPRRQRTCVTDWLICQWLEGEKRLDEVVVSFLRQWFL